MAPSTLEAADHTPLRKPLSTLSGSVSAFSGSVAGLAAAVAVCPLDVVKTRMQVQLPRKRAFEIIKSIYTESGVRGFYSGLTPLLIGYLPSWAIYFSVYQSLLQNSERGQLSYIGSATAAGVCSTLATNPLWMIKTRLMAQNHTSAVQYNGFLDAVTRIYRNEGVRAFYKGLGASLLGLPHVAIHFHIYESLKRYLEDRGKLESHSNAVLVASIFSKVVASTLTYPHEVVRAHMQTALGKSTGILQTAKMLYGQAGWRVFYAGLGTNICRAVPASAVTLVTFEFVAHDLGQYWIHERLNEAEMTDDAY